MIARFNREWKFTVYTGVTVVQSFGSSSSRTLCSSYQVGGSDTFQIRTAIGISKGGASVCRLLRTSLASALTLLA
jgi:hypothetical protein